MNVTETQPRTTEAPAMETIKPSEALREGAKMVKGQCRGMMFMPNEACALGAMLLGYDSGIDVESRFALYAKLHAHGLNEEEITNWNDLDELSFEAIARRLEERGL